MKPLHHIFFSLIFVALASQAFAQESSNRVVKQIAVSTQFQTIDSLPLVYGTVKVGNLDSSLYEIHHINSEIRFSEKVDLDSIQVSYRRLNFDLTKEYSHKDPKLIAPYESVNPFSYVPQSEKINYLNEDKINTLGAISRGIGFGNQQDVVVNSNLNLKMNGRLNNKIDVLAAISDQNNPIQADGNTQQLQDFDRVFVQFKQNKGVLTLGDFTMFDPDNSYFLHYQKRSRGLQFNNQWEMGKSKLDLQAEAAVSRGRFSRNTIEGSEGNQGPYRLTGARGEQFIIIIAGTEVVYVNGQKLVRGEQNDYVINYNSGEIVFTPKQLITRYSRIVVEFQYSDRNYGRSVVHTKGSYTRDKWSLNAHYFSEFDNKNQPFQQSLDIFDSLNNKSARQILAESGDAPVAYIPKINRLDDFNPDRIMYEQKDSAGYLFYSHSTNSEQEIDFYEVTFSFVGSGNGNYRQKTSTANGKVFEWVEPVNGEPQGDYEPVEALIPPIKLEVMTLEARYSSKTSSFSLELAQSNNDLNTFSNLDEDNDRGFGLTARWQDSRKFGKDTLKPKMVNSFVNYELKDKNFTPVERYRDVEFRRIWNRTIANTDGNDLVPRSTENILEAGVQLVQSKTNTINYQFTFYDPSSQKVGLRNLLQSNWTKKKTTAAINLEQMSIGIPMDTTQIVSNFLMYRASLSQQFKSIRVGGEWWSETSDKSIDANGETEATSYAFDEYSVFMQKADSGKFNYYANYRNRKDQNASSGTLRAVTDAQDLRLTSEYNIDRFNKLQLIGALRELKYRDTALNAPNENTLQGRLEYNGRLFKKAVRTSMFYELGTGQEQKKEFSFIQVGDGNGNFIWNDYDSNGIQSLDEFEIASELDLSRANFIRQFLPVQGFVKSYTNRFSHFVRFQPSAWWRNSKSPIAKGISRFSDVNTLRIDKKVTESSYEIFLNPFTGVNTDNTLVSQNSAWRNTIYFDQSNPVYGAEFSVLRQAGKLFLFNGFDSRQQEEYNMKVRWNFDKNWNTTIKASQGQKEFLSDYLSSRNYAYDFVRVEPKVTYQYKNRWRLGLFYQQFEAQNSVLYGNESSLSKELGTEGKITMVNRGVIQARFAYVNIQYDGDPSKAVAYELLRGLKDGVNYKWNAQVDYKFKNDIQMLFSYEGRKSELTDIIHIGRLQARYLF